MTPKPVRKTKLPAYPTKLDVLADPRILTTHIPSGWRSTEDIAKAFTVFLAANLAGCDRKDPAAGSAPLRPPRNAVAEVIERDAPQAGARQEGLSATAAAPQPGTGEGADTVETHAAPLTERSRGRNPFVWPPTPDAAEHAGQDEARHASARAASASPGIPAPVFEHGDGRGVTGCVVVSPPVFLSEEEALQVITEELGRGGVELSRKKVELGSVRIKVGRRYARKDGEYEALPAGEIPLTADAASAERHVAVEFVSQAEYYDLGGTRSMSSVQSYDFKEIALSVAEKVGESGDGVYFGTFYDPGGMLDRNAWRESWKLKGEARKKRHGELLKQRRAKSRELLREQVRDFVEWLRGQGVI